jgi:hypothetical protein
VETVASTGGAAVGNEPLKTFAVPVAVSFPKPVTSGAVPEEDVASTVRAVPS